MAARVARGVSRRFQAPSLLPPWVSCSSVSAAKASMIATYLSDKSALFKRLDADGNGKIDADELQAALAEAGAIVTPGHAKTLLEEADKDKSGTIESNELLKVLTKGTLFDGVLKR